MDYTIRVAKTKALISLVVTAKLNCVFVFAYAKSRFSHNEANVMLEKTQMSLSLDMCLHCAFITKGLTFSICTGKIPIRLGAFRG